MEKSRLDALSRDLQPETMPHRRDRAHDGRVVRVVRQVAHERLIDLQAVQREALQVAEAGVAGAQIIDRQAYAQLTNAAEDANGLVRVLDQRAFGWLNRG